jgi:uncharacterized protein (DUF2147 family)
MKTKFFSVFAVLLLGMVIGAKAQNIVGKWKTIDDETHKPKSIVQIYKGGDGKYYGKIDKLFRDPGEDPDPICDKCHGSKHNKKIRGMIIITGLEKKDRNLWDDGKILDPHNGKVYDCKMWIENGKLQVRGYLGWSLIGRSQTWLPYK